MSNIKTSKIPDIKCQESIDAKNRIKGAKYQFGAGHHAGSNKSICKKLSHIKK